MHCTNDTLIKLDTNELTLMKIIRQYRGVQSLTILLGVVSIAGSAYSTLWCLSCLLITAGIYLYNIKCRKDAELQIVEDYLKLLGNDQLLGRKEIPPALLSTMNGYCHIGFNATFRYLNDIKSRKSTQEKIDIFQAIQRSSFRKTLNR